MDNNENEILLPIRFVNPNDSNLTFYHADTKAKEMLIIHEMRFGGVTVSSSYQMKADDVTDLILFLGKQLGKLFDLPVNIFIDTPQGMIGIKNVHSNPEPEIVEVCANCNGLRCGKACPNNHA